ncbi:MAG: serine/threonine-protein kinase [candidate division Zixibacteria bacterium]|nr:serine/threonine-protein kinase [candidate division Zixibacteria bacterium]
MEEQFIGNYRILEKKGAGGMARVYLAVHKDVPNLKVILKILSDSRLIDRFRNEADKLALLDGNPNICRIKDFFSHGDETVIAMEYIDGAPLDGLESQISVAESVRIIIVVLEVLGFAHKKGIYHRDIKPGNIMLEKSGQVKVIDFGIAKGETDPNLTAAGSACGTPMYMAPEQFTPTEDTSYVLVDIYAVGTTLFWLLTGNVPFKGENEFAIRDAKIFNDPPSPRSLNPNIPKSLDKIILKSLAKDPKNRFSSTEEMSDALKKFGAGATAKRDVSDEKKTVNISVKKSERYNGRNWKPIVFSALVVIAALAVVAWRLGIFTPENPTRGRAEIDISPIADSVLFDDSLVAQRDSSVSIEGIEGQHELRLINLKAENSPIIETVTLTANSTKELNYRFIMSDTSSQAPIPLKGKVQVSTSPTADSVFFDNKLIAYKKSPVSIEGTDGKHNLKLFKAKATNSPIIRNVTITANQTIKLEYQFNIPVSTPELLDPIPVWGGIIAASRPRGATVYIDNVKKDQLTPYTFDVKADRHIVELHYDNQIYLDTVMISKNDTITVFYNFDN